jgi:hypothetical protein
MKSEIDKEFESQGDSGRTALGEAIVRGEVEAVKAMLSMFASDKYRKELLNTKGKDGKTCLDKAIGGDKGNIINLLRGYGAKTGAEIDRLNALIGGSIGFVLGITTSYCLRASTSFPKDIMPSVGICAGFAITGAVIGCFADTIKDQMSAEKTH